MSNGVRARQQVDVNMHGLTFSPKIGTISYTTVCNKTKTFPENSEPITCDILPFDLII